MEKDKVMRIFQMSDIHLFANKDQTLLQLNTYDSFHAVLNSVTALLQKHKPDLIVLTGDLSQDSSSESYQYLIDSMQNFACEIAWLPGNHDVTITLNKTLGKSYFNPDRHLLKKNWQIILLDSHQDGKVAGFLDDVQLNFLRNNLQSCNKPALIMLHHHVLPVGSVWLDKLNLINSEQFLQIIDQFPQVKGVVCGHVHQASAQTRNNVLFTSTPSTSIQFKPLSDKFALDAEMPGFNVFDLYEDGRIRTIVSRIAYNADYLPDLNSIGY